MTPLEIFEYKLRWKHKAFNVRLHSDLDWQGREWCKENLQKHQWNYNSWSDVYEHTFSFEHEEHAKEFAKQWPEFTNQ